MKVQSNGLELEYETFGDRAHPAILLIMGLGGQLIHWPEPFCEALAQAGHFVVRFDNRDAGLSSRIRAPMKMSVLAAGVRAFFGLKVSAPYSLDDMAADAVGLLDALGIERAHVIGVSMGGMIGQILALRYPQRVRSFVCWMSSSGNPRLPGPSLKVRKHMVTPPRGSDRESLVRHGMKTWRLIGSPAYPTDASLLRAKIERAVDRAHHPAGLARQMLAILAAPSRVSQLASLRAPTLVLHGLDDPLVPVAAGRELARHIPGARLETIAGYGHDLPPQLLPRFARLVLEHVQTASPGRV